MGLFTKNKASLKKTKQNWNTKKHLHNKMTLRNNLTVNLRKDCSENIAFIHQREQETGKKTGEIRTGGGHVLGTVDPKTEKRHKSLILQGKDHYNSTKLWLCC